MNPVSLGRVLGTGLRIAGRLAIDRLSAAPVAAPARAVTTAIRQPNSAQAQGVKSGIRGFFAPFLRIGSIVWHEVMGVLFLIPVSIYAPTVWKLHSQWQSGPQHKNFLVAVALVSLFLYLGISSFWRASKK